MKAKIVLAILFYIITTQVCLAGNSSDFKVKLDHLATVYIKKDTGTRSFQGIITGHEVLIRIDKFLLLGLDPKFNSKTREITLTSPTFSVKAKLGSKNVIINGRHENFADIPRWS